MLEAAALDRVGAQRIHGGNSVLDEARIRLRVNAKRRQGNDHLRGGLGAGIGGAVGVVGIEAAVLPLHCRQRRDRLVDRRPDLGVRAAVGRQRLQRHAGHIAVIPGAAEGPAAVRKLCSQDHIDQRLPGDVAARGDLVVVGVERDQRPDRAVEALLLDEAHGVQALQQVVTADVRGIIARRRQREDQAGVLRGLRSAEPAVFVDVGIDVFHNARIVAVRHFEAAAGQTQNDPLRAKDVHGIVVATEQRAGLLVDLRRIGVSAIEHHGGRADGGNDGRGVLGRDQRIGAVLRERDGVGAVAVIADGIGAGFQFLALGVIGGDRRAGQLGEDGIPAFIIAGLLQGDGQVGLGRIGELVKPGIGVAPVAAAVDERDQIVAGLDLVLEAPAGGVVQPVAEGTALVAP